MQKVLRIGKMEVRTGVLADIFIRIEGDKDKLSFTGVIGPKRDGDALGGCGQIDMEFAHRNEQDNDTRYTTPVKPADIQLAPGWDTEKWFDLLDAWKRWHMNDCKAGTPAQEAELKRHTYVYDGNHYGWALRTLAQAGPFTVWCYDDVTPEMDAALWAAALCNQRAPRRVKILATSRAFDTREAAQAYTQPIATDREAEIRGLECDNGYKYGSAWLKTEVPADVLTFLAGLPDADIAPVWV